jgi:asparagine synthase (glutamine-hydrolysing)
MTLVKLKTKVERFSNKEKVLTELESKLFNSIKKNVNLKDIFGIAFSGGVDSSLLAFVCKKLKLNFKLYTVSINDTDDLTWARRVSTHLKLPITAKIIDFDSAFEIIKKVTKLLRTDNPVQVGIGCTLYSVLEQAKNDNMENIMTGLGSDSLFCGFNKHRKAFENKELEKEIKDGIENVYNVDVKRDFSIANNFKMNLIIPYLEKEFMEYSSKIHPKLKINKDQNKIILRELAFKLGLKREFAYRKKVAAQYGSGFDNAIEVFAKENNFKTKTEFLGTFLGKKIQINKE